MTQGLEIKEMDLALAWGTEEGKYRRTKVNIRKEIYPFHFRAVSLSRSITPAFAKEKAKSRGINTNLKPKKLELEFKKISHRVEELQIIQSGENFRTY